MQQSLMVMPGAVHFVGWPMATIEFVCSAVRFMAIIKND